MLLLTFSPLPQDLENQVKTLTVEKAEAGALKIKLAEAESVADQIRKVIILFVCTTCCTEVS